MCERGNPMTISFLMQAHRHRVRLLKRQQEVPAQNKSDIAQRALRTSVFLQQERSPQKHDTEVAGC